MTTTLPTIPTVSPLKSDASIYALQDGVDRRTTPRDISGVTILQADTTFFVRADGNNGNSGLVDSAAGAWASPLYATDQMRYIDANGYAVTIEVRDGTYDLGGTDPLGLGGSAAWRICFRPRNCSSFQVIG